MCSIGGFIASKPISAVAADNLCTALLYYGQERGDQSGGVYANGKLLKKACSPFELANTIEFSQVFDGPTQYALTHTRQPTCGGTGDEQAQPFVVGRAATVHNGWFLNIGEIQKTWDIKKQSGVDSELVTQFIASYGIHKLPKFLKSVSGSAAFGIFYENNMYLMRDGNPTFWTILDFGDVSVFVFASTGRMLANAVRHAWLIPNDHPIKETKEGILFRCDPEKGLVKLSNRVSSKSYHSFEKSRYFRGKWEDSDYCMGWPTSGHGSYRHQTGTTGTSESQDLKRALGDYADLIKGADIHNESRLLDEAAGQDQDGYEDIRYFVPDSAPHKKD